MKCHYEVLEVARDSDFATIKASYRKQALKKHPDKNPNNPTAKEEFQQIQAAYDVLSDDNERAWYDRHREQILRGNQENFEDSCLDVFQYFTVTCFKGFGDDKEGFYSVYAGIFETIAAEDIEYMDKEAEFETIPKFGNSLSNYNDEVRKFYDYWDFYSTKKSYSWLFTHNINEIKERRLLKLIDKEHKKIQIKARKERNEEVRSMVQFVKKRDKRVIEYRRLMEEKAQQNRLKAQKNQIEQIKRRNEEISEQIKSKELNVNREMDEQMKKMEERYLKEYEDSESEISADEETLDLENLDLSENDDLYCVACNKYFNSTSAQENHEASKKHKQNVEIIKKSMNAEEEIFQKAKLVEKSESPIEDRMENGNKSDIEVVSEEVEIKSSKKNKKSKKKNTIKINYASDSDVIDFEEPKPADLPVCKDSDNENWNNKKGKKLKVKKNKVAKIETPKIEKESSSEEEAPTSSKKSKRPSKKKIDLDAEDFDIETTCVTCKKDCSSKNKLFAHLKETNHGVYLDKSKIIEKVEKGKKKK